MDGHIRQGLAWDQTIDITTTGRKTRPPRRIEVRFHIVEGRLDITGLPGRCGWYANLLAHPEFTMHLKESVRADLPARTDMKETAVFLSLDFLYAPAGNDSRSTNCSVPKPTSTGWDASTP